MPRTPAQDPGEPALTSDREPSFERLLDWVDGRLEPADAADVARAVESALPRTTQTVAWIRNFRAESARHKLLTPPLTLRSQLRSVFIAHHGSEDSDSHGGRAERVEVSAVLIFDSRHADLAGVRVLPTAPAVRQEPFQLVLRGGDHEILLEIVPGRDQAQLDGQVLGPGPGAGWRVALEDPRGRQPAQPTDDLGIFSFTVPLDCHRLVLDNGAHLILVDIDLSHPQAIND